MGAGRTELFTSMIGSFPGKSTGTLKIDGKQTKIKNPKGAIAAGIAYVSEDRKRYGLVLGMDIAKEYNISIIEQSEDKGHHR